MKTLIIYYSFSGRTRAIAKELAAKESADIVEIKDVKHLGRLKAYTAGIVASVRGKAWPIQPMGANFALYDRLILLAPIWANNPPPAFNAMLVRLPAGKTVSVKMVSMSGRSNCKDRLEKVIRTKGSIMDSFENIKA